MKTRHHRRVKVLLFIAVPLVLLAIFVEQWSWRPRVLAKVPVFLNGITFSPDGQTVALIVHGRNHRVELWDVAGGTRIRTLRSPGIHVYTTAFSNDGRTLAAAVLRGVDHRGIATWDIVTGRMQSTIRRTSEIGLSRNILLIRRPGIFATFGYKRFNKWDAQTLKLLNSKPAMFDPGLVAAFSRDGRLAIVARSLFKRNQRMELWDMHTGRMRPIMRGAGNVLCLAISPDNKTVALGTTDSKILLWDVDALHPYRTMDVERSEIGGAYEVWALAFSPDNKTLAVSTSDDVVRLWRVK